VVCCVDPVRGDVDGPGFIEVYVDAPLEVCEHRDPKGIYQQARSGMVPNFTGIDDPYEPPPEPDVHCLTALESVDESAARIVNYVLQARNWQRTR